MSHAQTTLAPPAPPPQLDIRSLNFARWKELTSATFHRRGENMQRLDAAVEAYLADKQSVEAMDRMRQAFRDWAGHKYCQRNRTLIYPQDFLRPIAEQLWSDEPRNARGAMTALFKLLFTPQLLALESGAARTGAEELAAIAWWKQEIDKRAYAIFKGQKLEFRLLTPGAPKVRLSEAADYPAQRLAGQIAALPGAAAGGAQAAGQGVAQGGFGLRAAGRAAVGYARVRGGEALELAGNAVLLASGISELARKIELSIANMAGTSNTAVAQTILAAMGMPAAAEIAGRMAPFFGGATSLVKGGAELARAVLAHRAAGRMQERQDRFRDGAARTAVRGIGKLLEEEAKAKAKAGGLHLVSGGTAIGLVFVDGGAVSGPAVGMAELLAELLLLAAEYVEDYKHREEVNRYLEGLATAQTVDVGVEMFEKSPLLGAYYLMIAETSTVIALSLDRINHPGVLQEIESIVREDLPEVLEKASELIAASHLVVPGLLSHRLHHEKTGTTRAWEAGVAVKGFLGRLASVACFRKNLGTNPPSNPRYVGISSEEYFAQQAPLLTVPSRA